MPSAWMVAGEEDTVESVALGVAAGGAVKTMVGWAARLTPSTVAVRVLVPDASEAMVPWA